MKLKKRLVCFILLFCFSYSLYGQKADTAVLVDNDNTSIAHVKEKKKVSPAVAAIIPAAMIGYGVISFEAKWARQLDTNVRDNIVAKNMVLTLPLDDYFQFSPAAAAFTLKAFGVESKHKLSDMIILYALSNLLETGIVYSTKTSVDRLRPNGVGLNSFPSGHTATAFVAAEFLHQEYGERSIWISIGGYSMATLIGVSRVYRNKHWVSDVIAGAGIGMLSTKVVYWTYPYLQGWFKKKDSKQRAFIVPSYGNGLLGLNISYLF